MDMTMEDDLVTWSLTADSTRAGHENIRFMEDHLSKLLRVCLSIEGDLGVKVGDVVKR
jgi:hypothetical protein